MELRGIYPYLVSPVDGGRVREGVLRALIDHLIEAGVHGLCPLGSTGEIMYLEPTTREEIVRITIDQAASRVPVIPGIAAFSSDDAARQAARMAELGASGIVAIQQVYFPVPTAGVVEYFTAVGTATDLPVVMYTNPRLGAGIPLEAFPELAAVPTLRYLKDAAGVTGRLVSIQERVGDRILHFAASAHVPALVFEIGGVGWMAGPACLAPRAAVELWRAHEEGRREDLWRLQRALWPLNELFTTHSLAAFIKLALTRQGFDVGAPLRPQVPLPSSVVHEFDRAQARIAEALGA
nr:dihydrodipicolinate synthase family protein [Actinomycetales bacterium]